MQSVQKAHVAICIPSRGYCDFGFTMDLATMLSWSVGNDVATVTLLGQDATYIHANRNDLVKRALHIPGVTHLLWLDDDMRFPKETMYRLLKHNEAFVGANYPTRRTPVVPVSIKTIYPTERKPGKRLLPPAGAAGLEEVDGIGFGVVLVRREVFEDVDFPWFECIYDRTRGMMMIGEDISFGMLAREKGYRIMVDHDLSEEIEHVGKFSYKLAHARAWAEEVQDLTEIPAEVPAGAHQ
jgi:hypothetical protein